MRNGTAVPKHQQVYDALEREIRDGRWGRGERIPSEAELVERFGYSRITVGRAVRDLERAGLVDRRRGSGTYVTAARPGAGGLSFGLLIPDLGETEIFEPICQGMMRSPLAREHALLWGSGVEEEGGTREERALRLCGQYVERRVSGVFFAPLELTPRKDEVNARIVAMLEAEGIPIVLLDRPVGSFPARGPHDFIGIDNRRAGYQMADHLLGLGCERVGFVGMPNTAATVDEREFGYREACHRRGVEVDAALVGRFDPADAAAVSSYLETGRPQGVVCANDGTAARLMQTLLRLGIEVPGDVRLVGIDDLEYAKLLPVPLTTLRQPTREIGAAAMAAMLDRVEHAELPARDILLRGELVVRESCGVALERAETVAGKEAGDERGTSRRSA
jgi:GntR family transcriptional regulator of arabinose operon